MPNILEWSPDGKYLVFGEGAKNQVGPRLLVVDTGGTRLRTLVVASEDVFQYGFHASVSPVNGDVLYSSCEFPGKPLKALQQTYWGPDGWKQERGTLIEPGSLYHYELAIVGLDGDDRPRLPHMPGWDIEGVWSPDGKRFAFLNERSGLLVAEEGLGGRAVYAGSGNVRGALRWSPDGAKILFAAATGGRDSYEKTLYVVDVETALQGRTVDALTEIVVTEPFVNVTVGTFSPDGEQVVWGERGDRRGEDDEVIYGGQIIYVGSADGSSKRRIVELPGGEQSRQQLRDVRWSPVDPRIMFWTTSTHYTDGRYGRETNAIYVVNQDGSGLTKIHEEVGALGGWAYVVVRWSPDGSRIAIGGGRHVATMAPDGTDLRVLAKRERRGEFTYVTVAANPRPPHPPVDPAACSNRIVIQDPEAEPGLVADCEALLTARDWFAGGVFLNWHEKLPIAAWEGVTVAGEPARVTEVVLRGLGLQGRMPTSFGRLEHLERLDLWHNEIRGQIPREFGDLTKLRSLDLSYNLIVGAIPPALGRLTNLEYLDLSHNQMSGPMPGELGALVDLRVLRLQDNNVGGAFPVELGKLGNLEELRVSRNRNLMGCVPDTLRAVEAVGTLLQRCWPEEDE